MIVIRTDNSVYEIDHTNRTWRRIEHNGVLDPIHPLRTQGGVLWSHGMLRVGHPAWFYGPPLDGRDVRTITTSPVTAVEVGHTDLRGLS